MVETLIRNARRRVLLNEILAQAALAAAITVAGFGLLLVFGTRYLELWTLALFAATGIALGAYRTYMRTPGKYATAVRVDESAGLRDSLSTAWYFREHRTGAEQFRQSQREQAEKAAAGVQLESAIPFAVPRSLYAMAALCLLVSGLIAVRYRAGRGLDLRAPITSFLFEDQANPDLKRGGGLLARSQKPWMQQQAESLLSKLGMAPKPEQPAPGEQDALDKAIEQALQNPANPDANSAKGGEGSKDGQSKAGEGSDSKESAGDPLDQGEKSGEQSGSDASSAKPGDPNAKSSAGKNGNPGNSEGLLSRLKDAMSNMLSKSSKDENSAQRNQQSAKNEKPGGDQQQAGKGQQEKGEGQADAQDGQPNPDGKNGQQAQGKLNSAREQPGQGGSGAGSQDGSKELKEAAQLKAMGKISEIIGQRSATVSGETSVEVQSGNQTLRTEYSKTAATHAETDGDVTRDQIPMSVQAYVQQYFAEVRKSSSGQKDKAVSKAPQTKATP